MNSKPIIIISGEPYSVFLELFFKIFKSKYINNYKRPIILISSEKLVKSQMKKLRFNIKINLIEKKKLSEKKIDNKKINLINVDFRFKKTFDKISTKSSSFIENCFSLGLDLMKKNIGYALINGPVSKKTFLKKKYLGITEYLSKKINTKNEEVMLIYNDKVSVSPITTHQPLKKVTKNISTQKIIQNIQTINNFYKKNLNRKARFGVCGLNPHCETNDNFSEENKIIKPAIKKLIKKKINVKGPFPADTLFTSSNIKKYDVIIGMYHDQVLTPIKALLGFDAINITLGLPFIRISPDHGPNYNMLGKNMSNPTSLFQSLSFLKKIRGI